MHRPLTKRWRKDMVSGLSGYTGMISSTPALDRDLGSRRNGLGPIWKPYGELSQRGTIINRLEDLHAALRVMDPDCDGSWIRRLIATISAQHVPAVRKRDRVVSATDLFELGLDLMRRASAANTAIDRAVRYRDGLMIAMLSTPRCA